MSLEGARFICLDEADNRGEIVVAKGRTFTVGYYVSCDYVLTDDRAKGVHCTIERDAFGRITIRNMCPEHPILVDGTAVENKRNLFTKSIISILDKRFLWEFSSHCDSGKALGVPEGDSTPNKQIGIPEHTGFSSPSLKTKKRECRFTIHNFAHCIKSDDEGNTSVESSKSDDSAEIIPDRQEEHSEDILSETLEKEQSQLQAVEREVSPELESKGSSFIQGTPKMNLINCTNDKENKGSTHKKTSHQLSMCHQSDVVITSFSPRETGDKTEKSFTAIRIPKVLVTGVSSNTPKSVYSTPKSVLDDEYDYNEYENNKSRDLINFHTPSTSNKAGSGGARVPTTSKKLKSSSMHIIDFTTPKNLAPASPYLKSALKASARKLLPMTPGISTLPCTPTIGDTNMKKLETPNSEQSVISVDSTDTSSVIEILSDASTPSLSSAKTPQKSESMKTQSTTKIGTPESVVKNSRLGTKPGKQLTTPQRRPDNVQITPRREPINRIPLRTSTAAGVRPSLNAKQTTSDVPGVRREVIGTPVRKNLATQRFDNFPRSNTTFGTPSPIRRSILPKSACKAPTTSTPLVAAGCSRYSTCNSTPLNKVRKSIGGITLSSHISKARKSIIAAAPTKFTSIKDKSPQQQLSDKILYRARKSVGVSPMIARAINMVQAKKDLPTISRKSIIPRTPSKSVLLNEKEANEQKIDRRLTFILDSNDKKPESEKIEKSHKENETKSQDEENVVDTENEATEVINLTFSPQKEIIPNPSTEETPVDVQEVSKFKEVSDDNLNENIQPQESPLNPPEEKKGVSHTSKTCEESFAEEVSNIQKEEKENIETVNAETVAASDCGEVGAGFGEDSKVSLTEVQNQDVLDKSSQVYKPIYEDITLEGSMLDKDVRDESVVMTPRANATTEVTCSSDETATEAVTDQAVVQTAEVPVNGGGHNPLAAGIQAISLHGNVQKQLTASSETTKQNCAENIEQITKEVKLDDEQDTTCKLLKEIDNVLNKSEEYIQKHLHQDDTNASNPPSPSEGFKSGNYIQESNLQLESNNLNENKLEKLQIALETVAENHETPLIKNTESEVIKESGDNEINKVIKSISANVSHHIDSMSEKIEDFETAETSEKENQTLASKAEDTEDVCNEIVEVKETESSSIQDIETEVSISANVSHHIDLMSEKIENFKTAETSEKENQTLASKEEETVEVKETTSSSIQDVEAEDTKDVCNEIVEVNEAISSSIQDTETEVSTTAEYEKSGDENIAIQVISDDSEDDDENIENENKQTREDSATAFACSKYDDFVKEPNFSSEEETNTQAKMALDNSEKENQTLVEPVEVIEATSSSIQGTETEVSISKCTENKFDKCESIKSGNENIAIQVISDDSEDDEENFKNENKQTSEENAMASVCSKNEVIVKEPNLSSEENNTQDKMELDNIRNVSALDATDGEKNNKIKEPESNKEMKLEVNLESKDFSIEEDNKTEAKSPEVTSTNEHNINSDMDEPTTFKGVESSLKSTETEDSEAVSKTYDTQNSIDDSNKDEFDHKIVLQPQEIGDAETVQKDDQAIALNNVIDVEAEIAAPQQFGSTEEQHSIISLKITDTEIKTKKTITDQLVSGDTSRRRSRRLSATVDDCDKTNFKNLINESESLETAAAESSLTLRRKSISTPLELELSKTPSKSTIQNETKSRLTPNRSSRRIPAVSTETETIENLTNKLTPRRSVRRASMSVESTTSNTPTVSSVKTRRVSLPAVGELALTPKRITRRRSSISLETDEVVPIVSTITEDTTEIIFEENMGAIIEEDEEESENNKIISGENNGQESEKPFEKQEDIDIVHNQSNRTHTHDIKETDTKDLAIGDNKECDIDLTLIDDENVAEDVNVSEQIIPYDKDVLLTVENTIQVEDNALEKNASSLNEGEIGEVVSVSFQDSTTNDVEKSVQDLVQDKSLCEVVTESESLNLKGPNVASSSSNINVTAEEDMDTLVVSDEESVYDYGKEVEVAVTPSLEKKDNKNTDKLKNNETENLPTVEIPKADKLQATSSHVEETGLRTLLKTPKSCTTPQYKGMRELLKTPKVAVTPVMVGVKELLDSHEQSHEKSCENVEEVSEDSESSVTEISLTGVKELLNTPKPSATPRFKGMRELMQTPKVNVTPVIDGVKELLDTPEPHDSKQSKKNEVLKQDSEYAATENPLTGVKELLHTPKTGAIPRFKGMRELIQTPKVTATPVMEGIKELLDTPEPYNKEQSTNNKELSKSIRPFCAVTESDLMGGKEMLHTPKTSSTPRFKGMRELMQTPKISATPVMRGIRELLNTSEQIEHNEETYENDEYEMSEKTQQETCDTPSSAQASGSAKKLLQSKDEELHKEVTEEAMHTPQGCSTPRICRKSLTALGAEKEMDDKNLDKFLKTPTAKNLMIPTLPSSAVIEKREDSVEMVHAIECNLNDTNEGSPTTLEALFKTPIVSRFVDRLSASSFVEDDDVKTCQEDKKFDSEMPTSSKDIADVKTPRQTLNPKLIIYKTPLTESPFSAADILTDLSTTEVENWVDKIDPLEQTINVIDGDDNVKVDEGFENSIRVSNNSAADDDSLSVVPETCVKTKLCNTSEAMINISTAKSTASKDPLGRSLNEKLQSKQNETADISGIDLLDETTESVLDNALVVSDDDEDEDVVGSNKDSNEDINKTIQITDINKDETICEDTANDLSEPLVLSDDEEIMGDQSKIVDKMESDNKTTNIAIQDVQSKQITEEHKETKTLISAKSRLSEDIFLNDSLQEEPLVAGAGEDNNRDEIRAENPESFKKKVEEPTKSDTVQENVEKEEKSPNTVEDIFLNDSLEAQTTSAAPGEDKGDEILPENPESFIEKVNDPTDIGNVKHSPAANINPREHIENVEKSFDAIENVSTVLNKEKTFIEGINLEETHDAPQPPQTETKTSETEKIKNTTQTSDIETEDVISISESTTSEEIFSSDKSVKLAKNIVNEKTEDVVICIDDSSNEEGGFEYGTKDTRMETVPEENTSKTTAISDDDDNIALQHTEADLDVPTKKSINYGMGSKEIIVEEISSESNSTNAEQEILTPVDIPSSSHNIFVANETIKEIDNINQSNVDTFAKTSTQCEDEHIIESNLNTESTAAIKKDNSPAKTNEGTNLETENTTAIEKDNSPAKTNESKLIETSDTTTAVTVIEAERDSLKEIAKIIEKPTGNQQTYKSKEFKKPDENTTVVKGVTLSLRPDEEEVETSETNGQVDVRTEERDKALKSKTVDVEKDQTRDIKSDTVLKSSSLQTNKEGRDNIIIIDEEESETPGESKTSDILHKDFKELSDKTENVSETVNLCVGSAAQDQIAEEEHESMSLKISSGDELLIAKDVPLSLNTDEVRVETCATDVVQHNDNAKEPEKSLQPKTVDVSKHQAMDIDCDTVSESDSLHATKKDTAPVRDNIIVIDEDSESSSQSKEPSDKTEDVSETVTVCVRRPAVQDQKPEKENEAISHKIPSAEQVSAVKDVTIILNTDKVEEETYATDVVQEEEPQKPFESETVYDGIHQARDVRDNIIIIDEDSDETSSQSKISGILNNDIKELSDKTDDVSETLTVCVARPAVQDQKVEEDNEAISHKIPSAEKVSTVKDVTITLNTDKVEEETCATDVVQEEEPQKPFESETVYDGIHQARDVRDNIIIIDEDSDETSSQSKMSGILNNDVKELSDKDVSETDVSDRRKMSQIEDVSETVTVCVARPTVQDQKAEEDNEAISHTIPSAEKVSTVEDVTITLNTDKVEEETCATDAVQEDVDISHNDKTEDVSETITVCVSPAVQDQLLPVKDKESKDTKEIVEHKSVIDQRTSSEDISQNQTETRPTGINYDLNNKPLLKTLTEIENFTVDDVSCTSSISSAQTNVLAARQADKGADNTVENLVAEEGNSSSPKNLKTSKEFTTKETTRDNMPSVSDYEASDTPISQKDISQPGKLEMLPESSTLHVPLQSYNFEVKIQDIATAEEQTVPEKPKKALRTRKGSQSSVCSNDSDKELTTTKRRRRNTKKEDTAPVQHDVVSDTLQTVIEIAETEENKGQITPDTNLNIDSNNSESFHKTSDKELLEIKHSKLNSETADDAQINCDTSGTLDTVVESAETTIIPENKPSTDLNPDSGHSETEQKTAAETREVSPRKVKFTEKDQIYEIECSEALENEEEKDVSDTTTSECKITETKARTYKKTPAKRSRRKPSQDESKVTEAESALGRKVQEEENTAELTASGRANEPGKRNRRKPSSSESKTNTTPAVGKSKETEAAPSTETDAVLNIASSSSSDQHHSKRTRRKTSKSESIQEELHEDNDNKTLNAVKELMEPTPLSDMPQHTEIDPQKTICVEDVVSIGENRESVEKVATDQLPENISSNVENNKEDEPKPGQKRTRRKASSSESAQEDDNTSSHSRKHHPQKELQAIEELGEKHIIDNAAIEKAAQAIKPANEPASGFAFSIPNRAEHHEPSIPSRRRRKASQDSSIEKDLKATRKIMTRKHSIDVKHSFLLNKVQGVEKQDDKTKEMENLPDNTQHGVIMDSTETNENVQKGNPSKESPDSKKDEGTGPGTRKVSRRKQPGKNEEKAVSTESKTTSACEISSESADTSAQPATRRNRRKASLDYDYETIKFRTRHLKAETHETPVKVNEDQKDLKSLEKSENKCQNIEASEASEEPKHSSPKNEATKQNPVTRRNRRKPSQETTSHDESYSKQSSRRGRHIALNSDQLSLLKEKDTMEMPKQKEDKVDTLLDNSGNENTEHSDKPSKDENFSKNPTKRPLTVSDLSFDHADNDEPATHRIRQEEEAKIDENIDNPQISQTTRKAAHSGLTKENEQNAEKPVSRTRRGLQKVYDEQEVKLTARSRRGRKASTRDGDATEDKVVKSSNIHEHEGHSEDHNNTESPPKPVKDIHTEDDISALKISGNLNIEDDHDQEKVTPESKSSSRSVRGRKVKQNDQEEQLLLKEQQPDQNEALVTKSRRGVRNISKIVDSTKHETESDDVTKEPKENKRNNRRQKAQPTEESIKNQEEPFNLNEENNQEVVQDTKAEHVEDGSKTNEELLLAETENTPSRRGRNVPQRRAATCHHSYDETSDSEKPEKKKKKTDNSPRKAIENVKNVQLESIASADTTSTPTSTIGAPILTARGRTRKPTARVQQFLEEERAKAGTPKKRSADTPTSVKAIKRGAKAAEAADKEEVSPQKTNVVANESEELKKEELPTTPPTTSKGRKTTRKAKVTTDVHQSEDIEEPPAKKSPEALEAEKDTQLPTRTAGKRNAAAAAAFRIEEDALATAAIDPPKKPRARKQPAKQNTSVLEKQDNTLVEDDKETLEETKAATKRGTRKVPADGAETTDHLASECLPAKKSRKVKTGAETLETEDAKPTRSAATTRGGRKNVHFESGDQNAVSSATNETTVEAGAAAAPKKRTTRTRRV